MKFSAALCLAFITACCHAQVPRLGSDTLLDIATWNVEWLGNTTNGPADENLQYNNVKNLISQTDFDVIALEEMSSENAFFNLSDALFAKYGSINSSFQATQKMCFFYKKNMFEMIAPLSQNILTQYASGAFATRPPLQVTLKTIGGNRTDTLYFIVVHLKAHTGTDAEKQESYNRRLNAASHLKTYTEQTLAGKKVIILGDWNDDLNTSLYNNLTTPFKQLLDAGYLFATKQLTDAGKKSYAFGSKMIDHILLSKAADSLYITASSKVFDNAGTYISNFSNTTSDHYPVYAFLNWKKLTTKPVPPSLGIEDLTPLTITIYPNPAQDIVMLSKTAETVTVYDATGKEQLHFAEHINEVAVSTLTSGVYYLRIETGGKTTVTKLTVSK